MSGKLKWINMKGEKIKKLHQKLQKRFPFCDRLSNIDKNSGYTPHLGVGTFKKGKGGNNIEHFKEKYEKNWKTLEFAVSEIYIIGRDNISPFQIYHKISLGKPNKSNKGKKKEIVKKVPKMLGTEKSLIPFYFSFEQNKWEEAKQGEEVNDIKSLKIVTWNILFDLYNPEDIHTDKRIPQIFQVLKEVDADIICLEEITTSLLKKILSLDWVRKFYIASDVDGCTLRPYSTLR